MPNVNYTNRKFTRILFDVPAELMARGAVWPCQLIDISLKGVLVSRPESWPGDEDESVFARIFLTEDIIIEMELEIAHCTDKVLGLRCVYIDLDSASHLRRLVELNLGDGQLLEREIGGLLRDSGN